MSRRYLRNFLVRGRLEAGCDEAGRGCLAGPVFAAAVILPPNYKNPRLNDSKKVSEPIREELRREIELNALSYGVGYATSEEIDNINILQASFLAMHRAIEQLKLKPDHLLIDGNRFLEYANIQHSCIIKGDGKFKNIAAASILAKTYRDDHMKMLAEDFPHYDWASNKGYGTPLHLHGLRTEGLSPHHRRSFTRSIELPLKEGIIH